MIGIIMLSKEERKKHLMMSLTCLRQRGEKRPIFSKNIPTKKELKLIRKGLKNGDIDEKLLKKFFPMAYEGVKKYGFFKYFFLIHNKSIRMLERYTHNKKLVDWCTAYPAKIVGKSGSKWVVERIDGKKIITNSEVYPGIRAIDETKLNIDSNVILHRDKIHMILNKKEYEKAKKFYLEFLRTKEIIQR
jgi:hypothetical protein